MDSCILNVRNLIQYLKAAKHPSLTRDNKESLYLVNIRDMLIL